MKDRDGLCILNSLLMYVTDLNQPMEWNPKWEGYFRVWIETEIVWDNWAGLSQSWSAQLSSMEMSN